ncbi:MAG: hypothetical protein V5A64_03350 [Candidatus Thermoplasmatota archaeon]
MNFWKTKFPWITIAFLAVVITIFSFINILYGKNWGDILLAAYFLLFILGFTIFFVASSKILSKSSSIEEFEKTLKGGLYHFKCPHCNGVFAIKKSTGENKNALKMNCPDCGKTGIIPGYQTMVVEEEIPEKKSPGVNFRCNRCNERLTIWAEGANIHPDLKVFNCPFCGEQEAMGKVF